MATGKYSVETAKTGMELQEDLHLHEKGWIIQRIGWAVLFAVIIAGIIGVFGNGWVSYEKIAAKNITIKYDRFLRYRTETSYQLQSSEHVRTISFPEEFLKNFEVVRFIPEPVENSSSQNNIKYSFNPGDNRIITIYLTPQEYGTVGGQIAVNNNTKLNLAHFIYP